MNKKTVITICLSVVVIAAAILTAILLSPKDRGGDASGDAASAAETLPVTSEGETADDGTGSKSTDADPSDISGAAGSATSADISGATDNTDFSISGDVGTVAQSELEEYSLEVYVPTDTTYESTRDDGSISYLAYLALTAKEKEAYYDSFTNPADFYTWFNSAYDEYMEELNPTQIGPAEDETD